jgi:FAD/FMN-containing dehydrogenase/Fe-S oxidoreductase
LKLWQQVSENEIYYFMSWFDSKEKIRKRPEATPSRHIHSEPGQAHRTFQELEAGALAHKLRRKIKGEVRFTDGDRALYATDSSNYRQIPIGVVIPRDVEDVIETVALCREFGAPVLPRGGGTSLAGQCCNVAVILDFSKYVNRILEIDPVKKIARIEPGLIADHLSDAAAKHQLFWAPSPATHQWCTFGGMLGNNSCGVHSQMAGRSSDNLVELEILTYRGERMRVGQTSEAELEQMTGIASPDPRARIYTQLKTLRDRYAHLIRARYPKIPRRISGFGLNELLPERGFHVARALAGSEGTCVTILQATVQLAHKPSARAVLVLGYPDIYSAADHIAQVDAHKPIGLEGIDGVFIDAMRGKNLHLEKLRLLPDGRGFLLIEFGGESPEECADKAHRLMRELKQCTNPPAMRLIENPSEQRDIWKVRDSGLGATAHPPERDENHEGWEDSAVPPEKLGVYLRELRGLFNKFGYHGSLYGHFGQACVHTRIDFDLKTAHGIQHYREFVEQASDLVVKMGGSFSGEHGDGQSRAELLPKMFGPELVRAFEEFKAIWDPDWKMNPGKVVRPYRLTDNLRYGTELNRPSLETYFSFTEDNFNFANAAMRCVGVGECRRHENGTMCPSYMVTHEEKHTTRGRARLLFEMLQANPLRHGWHSPEVKESLDLCLSCKGCKGDCPVNVDMATYKAEFLAHYYKHRLRPIHAYVFGLIHRWARIASVAPRLANLFAQSPVFGGLGKWLAGIAPERSLPEFAEESFKKWFQHRRHEGRLQKEQPRSANRVILWPDTFNNYFHPQIAIAATEVLEDAGFEVIVPQQNFCCGRPLYDYGMLKTAQRWLENILDGLRTEIRNGTPVVVLEPSCASVFRDELTNILPHDLDARRLKEQTFLLSEFLQKKAPQYQPRQLERKALVHVHCHHRAIMKPDCEAAMLQKVGLNFEILESGCCGMAGAFGFEKGEHYDVSVKCGERVLLPKVRESEKETLLITDGFSCHEQIRQQTGREALHPAQVLRLAMSEGKLPGRKDATDGEHEPPISGKAQDALGGLAVAGALAGAVAVAMWWTTRNDD